MWQMLGLGISGIRHLLLFLNIRADRGTVATSQGDIVSDRPQVCVLYTPQNELDVCKTQDASISNFYLMEWNFMCNVDVLCSSFFIFCVHAEVQIKGSCVLRTS